MCLWKYLIAHPHTLTHASKSAIETDAKAWVDRVNATQKRIDTRALTNGVLFCLWCDSTVVRMLQTIVRLFSLAVFKSYPDHLMLTRGACVPQWKKKCSTWPKNVTLKKEQKFVAIVNQMCMDCTLAVVVQRWSGGRKCWNRVLDAFYAVQNTHFDLCTQTAYHYYWFLSTKSNADDVGIAVRYLFVYIFFLKSGCVAKLRWLWCCMFAGRKKQLVSCLIITIDDWK